MVPIRPAGRRGLPIFSGRRMVIAKRLTRKLFQRANGQKPLGRVVTVQRDDQVGELIGVALRRGRPDCLETRGWIDIVETLAIVLVTRRQGRAEKHEADQQASPPTPSKIVLKRQTSHRVMIVHGRRMRPTARACAADSTDVRYCSRHSPKNARLHPRSTHRGGLVAMKVKNPQ